MDGLVSEGGAGGAVATGGGARGGVVSVDEWERRRLLNEVLQVAGHPPAVLPEVPACPLVAGLVAEALRRGTDALWEELGRG